MLARASTFHRTRDRESAVAAMEQHKIQCEALINKCKQEAKQLAELAATKHKVHWTQSCFVSFCISVEDVLCYGIKKRYTASKQLSPSGKILADLGKTFPVAAATFNKCYGSKPASSSPEDYAHLVTSSATERRILWLRVAIIESSLVTIVNEIIKNAGKYYTEYSILCHPVYGEVFGYLLDGPCSIRVSRLKIADTAITSPTPAEIVKRHNKVLSASVTKAQQDGQSQTGTSTEEAWDHVKALYQTSAATCLFGKNNVHVQPAGFSETLAGYLTLQRVVDSLQLKWIPNSLLNSASSASSSLWEHVLSLDVGTQVAHIHCHRTGDSAELILIGYDGITLPGMVFLHLPSLFQFLECLENNLLPRGCLEPPLWYIKAQATKEKRSTWRPLPSPFPSSSSEWGVGEGEEWWEGVDVWNRVFRVRFGGKMVSPRLTSDPVIKGHIPHLPLNLDSLRGPLAISRGPLAISRGSSSTSSATSSACSSPRSSTSEDDHPTSLSAFGITIDKPSSLARKDWEKFQLKVSKQLLARYFYSWLSYCRHMKKVHHMVAHMVDTTTPVQGEDPANYKDGDVKKLWMDFQANRNEGNWSRLLRAVYVKGIPEHIRPEIWPWLIGVYPTYSTDEETESIRSQADESYQQELQEWRKIEVVHLRILAAAERERQERWKRECATHISHTDRVTFGERGGEGGRGEEVDGENGVKANGEEEVEGELLDEQTENGCGREEEGSAAVNGESGEGPTADCVKGSLCSKESSTATLVPMEDHPDLHNGHTHTSPSTAPHVTTPSHISRSPSPEMSTLSDISLVTQSTASPLPSPHTSHKVAHNHITSTSNDIIEKARSGSLDSGHSSGCNLGNSIGSGHGNGVMNGCHGDDSVSDDVDSTPMEWNGDSNGLVPSQGGESGGSKSTLLATTDVVDGAMEGREEEEGEGEMEGEGEGEMEGEGEREIEGEGEREMEGEGEGEMELDEKGRLFAEELIKIDKDIPRCDRDYWFFKEPSNLTKLRNIVSTYVWTHLEDGYSQGMCDLLAPLLVILGEESLTYACYLRFMKTAIQVFPPHNEMQTKLSNVNALLQVLEPDFFQYLSEQPLGDGLFLYCHRWFLVCFKREFEYSGVFRLWETWWAASQCCSAHFLEFCGLAIMTQFKPAIMDAHMDSYDILNLFTDLADKKTIDCNATITIAQATIRELVCALTRRE